MNGLCEKTKICAIAAINISKQIIKSCKFLDISFVDISGVLDGMNDLVIIPNFINKDNKTP